jgi:glycosyltransferase involved in cell wall biosynthesis
MNVKLYQHDAEGSLQNSFSNIADAECHPVITPYFTDVASALRTLSANTTTGASKKINSIVAIPSYNEEIAIGSVVARAKLYADEVIVIDDGSDDRTAEVAHLVGAVVIKHEKNTGYGAAISTCFEAARGLGVETMVIIDADGQHDPDDIPLLFEEIDRSGADIVIGSRFANGSAHNKYIPLYRKFGMKVLNRATNLRSRSKVSDSQSGFRAYSKRAIHSIYPKSTGMGAGSEILIRATECDLKITEVPITVRYDIENRSSKSPIAHGWSVIGPIIRLIAQKRPIYFFGVPGLVSLLLGISFFFLTLDKYNATKEFLPSYATIATFTTIMGAYGVFTALILWSIQELKHVNYLS